MRRSFLCLLWAIALWLGCGARFCSATLYYADIPLPVREGHSVILSMDPDSDPNDLPGTVEREYNADYSYQIFFDHHHRILGGTFDANVDNKVERSEAVVVGRNLCIILTSQFGPNGSAGVIVYAGTDNDNVPQVYAMQAQDPSTPIGARIVKLNFADRDTIPYSATSNGHPAFDANPALNADGTKIAYKANDGRIYLASIPSFGLLSTGTTNLTLLSRPFSTLGQYNSSTGTWTTVPLSGNNPCFSPNGSTVAFDYNGDIYSQSTSGTFGASHFTNNAGLGQSDSQPTIGQDEYTFAFRRAFGNSGDTAIILKRVSIGPQPNELEADHAAAPNSVASPDFGASQQTLTYSYFVAGGSSYDIRELSAPQLIPEIPITNSSTIYISYSGPVDDNNPVYNPDASRIAFDGGDISGPAPRQNTPSRRGILIVPSAVLDHGVGTLTSTSAVGDVRHPSWSIDIGPPEATPTPPPTNTPTPTPPTNYPPTNDSLNPTSVSTLSDTWQTFAATYSDLNGAADISVAHLVVGNGANGVNSLYTYYNNTTNKLYLRNDAGTAWMGGVTPGTAGAILSNTQGSLDCEHTAVVTNGTTLQIGWVVKASSAFGGTRQLALIVYDLQGQSDGDIYGNWTINSPPVNTSVTPTTASDAANGSVTPWRTFTATYTDLNGQGDIALAHIIVGAGANGANSIYAYYNRSTNKLYLRNDAGTAWTGGFTPGAASGIISNSQGSLDCTNTTVTPAGATGNALTITWVIRATTAFAGTRPVSIFAKDFANQYNSAQQFSTWTISN